jgi:hypothetical protein
MKRNYSLGVCHNGNYATGSVFFFFFYLCSISSVAYQRGSLRARQVAILSWGGWTLEVGPPLAEHKGYSTRFSESAVSMGL